MVNGDDWFENPLDSMPIAKDDPKIKLSFDGCYNYKKLKEEGLIEEDKIDDDEFIRLHQEFDR